VAAGGAAGLALLGTGTLDGKRERGTSKCDAFSTAAARRSGNSNGKSLPIACRDGTMVFPWMAPTRKEQLDRLKEEQFDLLVIGGGCVGSGVALDAQTRGLKVAVVERDDFAAGTSGRSTKLIHGGVRYLENAFKNLDYGQYKLVREALAERSHMLRAAPYIARAVPIMVPLEKWWTVPYYYVGTKVYDLVAGDSIGVPRSMFLSKEQAIYNFPMLNSNKLSGAIVYYDGQMNDTRYSLMVMLTAVQAGATVANYLNCEQFLKDDKGTIKGARVKDMETGEEFNIRAKAVVNATGPFSDTVRRMARSEDGTDHGPTEEDNKKDIMVGAGGIHLMLPDHFSPSNMGLIVPNTSDGRVLFFLPWEGGTLCGTTDSESPITMLPKPSSMEVDFVLKESERYLNRRIKRKDVRSAWSGIRPLVKDISHGEDTKVISREHVVEVGDGGLVSICGGKWTTYRKMAQDAVDAAIKSVPALGGRAGECVTEGLKLIGADRAGIVCEQKFDIITITLREDYGYDRDIAEHLTRNYGTRALQIAEIVKQGYPTRPANQHPKRLVAKHSFLEAEVVFAVRHEYAVSLVDVLARRTRMAYVDHDSALAAMPQILDLMGTLLSWNKAKKELERKRALEFLETMQCPEV